MPESKLEQENKGMQNVFSRRSRYRKEKEDPESSVEETDSPAEEAEGAAYEMSKAESKLVRDITSADQRQDGWDEHQSRHSDDLLFDKVVIRNRPVPRFRDAGHAGNTQRMASEVCSQIYKRSQTQMVTMDIAERDGQSHQAKDEARPGEPSHPAVKDPVNHGRHDQHSGPH